MKSIENKFDPGTAAAPTSTVEISISCRRLLDKDVLSKSDPMCVVYHQPRGSNHWVEWMRTETIRDTLNPDFASKITIEYRFEELQQLRFELYDIDMPTPVLSKQDFLGSAECTVGQIVSAGPEGLSLPLKHPQFVTAAPETRKAGSIILIAEELASLKDEVTFKLGGVGLGKVSCFLFRPSVFFVLSKVNEARNYVIVYRSENELGPHPTWRPATISVRSLCNGDPERSLKLECYFHKRSGTHRLIGTYYLTLNKMIEFVNGGMKLTNKNGQELTSTLVLRECRISPIYTFVDYIQSGTKIHCCFAIDFTSSNGDPGDMTSLHHFSPAANRMNPYEQAISSVGDIIKDYDVSNMFPVFGFGARIPPYGSVSHNFYVNLTDSASCYGIQGVLDAYRNCIRQVQLYGPTNFAPVINHVAQLASQNQGGDHYYVLLIVTDGVITDMPNTKEAIVNASRMPLSIIIVGVGGADFSAMEELDGDSVRISSNGVQAARDIVQFVPYRDAFSWMASTVGPGLMSATTNPPYNHFQQQQQQYGFRDAPVMSDSTQRMAQVKLAQEVLAEIPEQVTSYMKNRGIFPVGRPQASNAQIMTP